MAEYSVSLGLQVQQALRGLKQLTTDFLKLDKEVDEVTASLNKFENELKEEAKTIANTTTCLLYTSPSPRDRTRSRMPSSA